ncbi:unnamed protein product, partial [Ectocarpus sp. 12 AP-2014]
MARHLWYPTRRREATTVLMEGRDGRTHDPGGQGLARLHDVCSTSGARTGDGAQLEQDMIQGVSKSQPAGEQLTASQPPPPQGSPQSLVDCDDAGAAGAFPSTADEACVA